MKSTYKRIGTTVLRSAILFLAFGVIAVISRFIFNLFVENMLSSKQSCTWHTVFLFFIFWSTVYAFNRHRSEARNLFLEKYVKGRKFGKVKSGFTSPELYIEYSCTAILSFILPLSFTYDCVGVALCNPGYRKTQILLFVLPIFLVIEILVHLSVRNAWISDGVKVTKGKKEGSERTQTIKGIISVAGVYCAASLVFPWAIPFLISFSNLGLGGVVCYTFLSPFWLSSCFL